MRCFITGGSGFVGKNFIEYCIKHHSDLDLICLVRNMEASSWMQSFPQITRIEGDLLNPASYQEALSSSDIVFHLAALVGLRDGEAFYQQNVETTRLLVNACQSVTGVKRFVFISSIAAVDRPKHIPAYGALPNDAKPCPSTDYGKSKLLAEQLIRGSGLPYTILRPSFIYGRYLRKGSSVDKFCQDILQQRPYILYPFSGRVSGIHTDDLAEALWRASQTVKAQNKTYFVSNSDPLVILDVIQRISAGYQLPYQTRVISESTLERLKSLSSYRAANPMLVPILFEDAFYCDSSPLWRDLNWQPRYSYESGISDCLNP